MMRQQDGEVMIVYDVTTRWTVEVMMWQQDRMLKL